MNGLFMVSGLAGYMHACIKVFVDTVSDASATIISNYPVSHAPYVFTIHPRIQVRNRELMTKADWNTIRASRPDFVYIGGWTDPIFRSIAASFRSEIPVIMGMDNQWNGTAKQWLMSTIFAPYLRAFCTHIWIPGFSQYEYARRLGFPRRSILTGLYSADTRLYADTLASPGLRSPKILTFIGTMWPQKGVHELVEAFRRLAPHNPEWRLKLVGGGPLVDQYRYQDPRIDVVGFRQPTELPHILSESTAFCLPSYYDQWGVVIHEACCVGLPVIATDACGAVSAFVHEEYNGFRCAPKDLHSLTKAIHSVMQLPPERLALFGKRSYELSRQITQDLWVSQITTLNARFHKCAGHSPDLTKRGVE